MRTWLRRMVARLRALVASRDLDRDFDQELASHVAMQIDENLARGMTPEQARRAALIRVGGAQSLKQQHRDARGFPLLEDLLQDLRFTFRIFGKDRWFSAAAILVLACGIGINATGFTIVNSIFWRALPFENPDQLLMVNWINEAGRRVDVSPLELQDWRTQSRTFVSLAGYRDAMMNISDDRAFPERVRGTWITANSFGVIGRRPMMGRDFLPEDERRGADPVVIIGHQVWTRRYASDPGVLGRVMRIDGQPATIVGVMAEHVKFPDNTDVWAPFIPTEAQLTRTARPLTIFGRVNGDVTLSGAQAEFSRIAQQMTSAFPSETEDFTGLRVETFHDAFIGGMGRPMFITVMGATVFVLLIACANVANLLLSRSGQRAREVGLRMAMGATRSRVVRQLLLESVVLSLVGGVAGVVLAAAGIRMFDAASQASGLPYWVVFTIDDTVFAYVAAVCTVTGVLFGLAPALHISDANHMHVLKEGGRGTAGARRMRIFSTTMVVSELAFTMMLLAGAALMVRSFYRLYNVDLGIRTDNLMTMSVRLPEERYPDPAARLAFFERLEPRLSGIPGVEAAAVTTGVPPLDGGERIIQLEGQVPEPGVRGVFVGTVTITPRFFDTVGVKVLRGRSFTDSDGTPGLESVIVNQRLAERLFPGDNPIGRRIRFTERRPPPNQPPDLWRTIVGIVPVIRQGSPDEAYVNSVAYVPYRQETPSTASLLVRSALPPESIVDAVRRAVAAVDADQPVYSVQTVAQLMAADRWWHRLFGSTFGIFAAVALMLSSVGLYAVMAYSVTQRTQEIGVRMAVGAQRGQVSWLILRQGLTQVVLGLVLGLGGAFVIGDILSGSLVEITATDPVTLAAISVLLIAVSTVACLLPALRATRVDPVVSLRSD